MKYYLAVLFSFLYLFSKGQQDRIKFSRISVEEGLSQSSAFAIAHDSIGYIWIGTYDGLNRYSGYDIKTYRHNTEDSLSLSDNYIQALCVDESGRIWIGTNSKGICIFDHAFEEFTQIPIKNEDNKNGLEGNSVLTLKRLDTTTMVALTNEGINLIEISSGNCKLISEKEYFSIENAPSLVSYFNKDKETNASCYLSDSKGDQWMGTDNGLLRKPKGTNQWTTYKNELYDPNSISADEVTSLMEDRGGVIWVGTSLGGVCKWDRLNEGILLYRNNPILPNTLSNSKVRSFFEDSKGRIWVGTVSGGLNLWNKETDVFTHWNTESDAGLNNNHIREVTEWQGKHVVATDGGGLQTFSPDVSPIKFTNLPIEGMEPDARVWDIHANGNELWIATYDQGLFLLKENVVTHYNDDIDTEKVTWVTSDTKGNIWVATFGSGLYLKTETGFLNWNTSNSSISDDRIYSIVHGENSLFLGTKGGVNQFQIDSEVFTSYSVRDGLPNETVMGIITDNNDGLWITTNRGICHFMLSGEKVTNYDINDGLQNNEFLVHSFLKLSTGEMLFGGINGFNVIAENGLSINPYPPQIVLTNFTIESGDWTSDTSISKKKLIELEHYQNEFAFEFAALGYAGLENNTYSYIMEGFDDDWKMSDKRRFSQYTNLPNGKYVFKVKAANNDGVWNETPASIRLIVHPAYWQTMWFKITAILISILALFTFYRLRTRQMQKRNNILEREVTLRTKEVVAQKKEIEDKNHMIEEAFKDIQDSIMYAKRIQHAILPPDKIIKEHLTDSFILFLPKDIVAGDFYWFAIEENKVLFAAADCTGHGVPGALVSVLCNNALNRAVREYGILNPGEILDKAREIIVKEFEMSEEEVKDGMDIALCSLEGNKLQYAGAHNPLWIVRKGEILETKANKEPVGKFEKPTPFITHEIELEKEDTIYLFSDGYADQFGGEKGKKFKSTTFKKLLLDINGNSMDKQKALINDVFEEWKGSLEQLDDVCVIGVRV